MEFLAFWMFAVLMIFLLSGYPVAFALGGTAVLFTVLFSDLLPTLGLLEFPWDPQFRIRRLQIFPQRVFGSIMDNYTLVAVPFFVFMGVMLERSGLAEDLLQTMGRLFGRMRGGLAISVVAVGALLAASTGVVGASVVTMAVLALPVMLKYGYDKGLASGAIASSGTLGQIIPPSIVLIILGDQMAAVNVGDLFMGALIPGIMLAGAYILWIAIYAFFRAEKAPAMPAHAEEFAVKNLALAVAKSLLPPLILVAVVLGTIFYGIASPTEAGAMGAFGATILAFLNGRLTLKNLRAVNEQTVTLTSMVFIILVGATAFAMVFNALGGHWLVEDFLKGLPGGEWGFLFLVMLAIFILGFFLDFIEITFIVIPLVAPVAVALGFDPVWFAVLIAMNLQASFLTPPFGFALFYLRGAAPPEVGTRDIYRGIVPFIIIQLLMLVVLVLFPEVVLWLPEVSRA
ncbi:MAG: TRAP transporter large permease subunit [Ectothiorhodospiraceae bacterium]|nr:TRAP transporter large permease subunit [Ectothiorhodospiraceae bacterium]